MRDLNFFSIYQGNTRERNNDFTPFYIASAVVAITIIAVSGFYAVRLFMVGSSIKEYTDKLNSEKIQTQLKEAEVVNDKLSILKEYEGSLSSVINSIRKADLIDAQFLPGMAGAVPSDISYTEWKMEGYELKIKGISKTRSAVAELEHNLKALPELKLVHVYKIRVGDDVKDPLTFEMTCVFKEVE